MPDKITPQELIDLAEQYKVMMESPAWKHFEKVLKGMYDEAMDLLEVYNRPELEQQQEFAQLKMLQTRRKVIREIMDIGLVIFANADQAKKRQKQIKKGV